MQSLASMKYFSGIGSRKTPSDICQLFGKISTHLCDVHGYTLRSGGADGADLAFEQTASNKDIYLPWKLFNNNESLLYDVCDDAKTMAQTIHPKKTYLVGPSLLLHARNCYQVLGKDLNTPSDFLLCWTEDGKTIGGTATAIKLAIKHDIPVLNFGKMTHCHFEQYLNFLEKHLDLD